MSIDRVLKADSFGTITFSPREGDAAEIVRDSRAALRSVRRLAGWLAAREAAALRALRGVEGVPRLIGFEHGVLRRSFMAGEPMHVAKPCSREYFASALKLVAALHRHGIAHNDLAKEPNWLCTPGGRAAIVDFQLAIVSRRRGKLFRVLAREDLRHLLKHKRTYSPGSLTARQRRLLAHPSLLARCWRTAIKPGYVLVTRRVLGWPERTGPAERER
jgi:hypothetical protein